VQEYEQHEMSREHFDSQNQEFPPHYTVMSYTLSPDPTNLGGNKPISMSPRHSAAFTSPSLVAQMVRLPSFSAAAVKASSM